uniref:Uncharacterized protein n=1 Tax=Arundo donax TaxID=35708 RepID=A0A0A9A485_ARUDO
MFSLYMCTWVQIERHHKSLKGLLNLLRSHN